MRIFTSYAVMIVYIALAVALWPPDAEPQTMVLRLATDDTPGTPWIIGGGNRFNDAAPGIEIELYGHMARRLNLRLHLERMPWKRCLAALGQGTIDGIFPASFKPERLKLGAYPMRGGKVDPVRKSRDSAYYLYTLNTLPLNWDGRSFANLEQMKKQTIGVPLGWSIVSDLRRMDIDLLEKPRPIDLLSMLERGGLAGVVCLDTVMDTYIDQMPDRFGQIRKVDLPMARKAYYLMLSHAFASRYPTLADRIWDTIAAIKSEELFDKIVARYLE
jgi:polar amino acid transport system substrate-binding protein